MCVIYMGSRNPKLKKFRVQHEKKGGFESEAKIRDFSITIDEPEPLGGTNKGPNPIEVLLASLGGCLDFTGTIVAKEMGYDLEEFKTEIEGEMDPGGVQGKEGVVPGLQRINVSVTEIKGIPDNEKEKFIEEIKNRCPVEDTLERSLDIEVER